MDAITVRASSLSTLFSCPAMWEAKFVKGLRLPTSGKAQLGRAIHASTAVFDESRITGQGITPDEAAGALVDAINRPDEDVAWEEGLNAAQAEKTGLHLHGLYCAEVAPTQDYIAVEATCEAVTISDLGLVLTGTTDRVRRTDDGLGVADLKTGGAIVSADGTVNVKGHGIQLAVYEILAGQAVGERMTAPAQIVGLQTAKTPKGMRVATATVPAALDALVGDEDNPGLLQFASQLLHKGMFYGNPSNVLCSEKFCPAYKGCRFRG